MNFFLKNFDYSINKENGELEEINLQSLRIYLIQMTL